MRKAAWIMVIALVAVLAAAQDKSSNLKFTVVKADNGKPVRNASVVLHPVNKDGRQSKGGFELKTNSEGETSFDGAPYGKLRVQVLAHGFQTYGQDFEIEQPKHEFVIKLKRPQQQYSIYGDDKDKKDDAKPKQ
ncbi:MAG: carboxypeptidase-like regulatory domain-containing protein [Terriglobales bacterium]